MACVGAVVGAGVRPTAKSLNRLFLEIMPTWIDGFGKNRDAFRWFPFRAKPALVVAALALVQCKAAGFRVPGGFPVKRRVSPPMLTDTDSAVKDESKAAAAHAPDESKSVSGALLRGMWAFGRPPGLSACCMLFAACFCARALRHRRILARAACSAAQCCVVVCPLGSGAVVLGDAVAFLRGGSNVARGGGGGSEEKRAGGGARLFQPCCLVFRSNASVLISCALHVVVFTSSQRANTWWKRS